MITCKRVKRESLGRCCRECLNEKYHLRLKREDCIYLYYPYKCRKCGRMKNIVQDIRWISRWKLVRGREVIG